MGWLLDIIKHLTISRSVTAAAFITSATLLFGHRQYPTEIETVPAGWAWAVIAIFVFTACLLTFWSLRAIGRGILASVRSVKGALPLPPPEGYEIDILYVLAKQADQPLNLDVLYRRPQVELSKLALLETTRRLCEKGYAFQNPYEENLVFLTMKGRKCALDLEARMDARQGAGEA